MKNKCINYKFLLLMLFPLVGIILSIAFLCQTSSKTFSLLIFGISLSCASLVLCFEPIAYIIKESEIKVICAFKQYRFFYKEVQQIELKFDAFFEFLFVKDYVLSIDIQNKVPERCRRILKNTNTKKLIEKYYDKKVNF